MRKKLIIGIVTMVLTIIFGKCEILEKTETNIEAISKEEITKQEEIEVEEKILIAKEEIATEAKEEEIVDLQTKEKQEIETTAKEVIKTEIPKKEESLGSKEIQKMDVVINKSPGEINGPGENKFQEEKIEEPIKTTESQEEQKIKTEENILIETKQAEIPEKIQEEKMVQDSKEKMIYNKNATQKLIDDINEFAKQNTSLWDANGNKLYKIEIVESLVGGNYMSPYKKHQVAGVVLNVFPVKFLVYAIDIEKDGFTKETRYYIDVASLN